MQFNFSESENHFDVQRVHVTQNNPNAEPVGTLEHMHTCNDSLLAGCSVLPLCLLATNETCHYLQVLLDSQSMGDKINLAS